MQHNEVKKKDKRKIYTLLKLIGRTGIWKILNNWNNWNSRNAANRSGAS